jgi:hypothetical protein
LPPSRLHSHVSQNNTNRRSAIDGRTTRHPSYRLSTISRKRIEEPRMWLPTIAVICPRTEFGIETRAARIKSAKQSLS